MVAVADRLLGTLAGAYRIERLLGKGGMGRVYRATHVALGFPAAVKVIAEHYAEDAQLVERFFAEARTIAAFQHEHVVRILDLVRLLDGRPAIVMELVEGESLRAVMQAGRATLGTLLTLMADALTGLAAAHAAGIIHRDLKPENILVAGDGRVKLLDFGIAKHLGTALQTQTGVVLGTPQYMAPEQIRGLEPSQSSDLYAMGVILFEIACGRRPFDAATDYELMRMHVEVPAPLARTVRPSVPATLESVIATTLAKSPDQRFASAPALANALREVARQLPVEQQPGPGSVQGILPTAPARLPTLPTVSALPDRAVPPTSALASPAPRTPGPRRRRSRVQLGLALGAVVIGGIAGTVMAMQRARGSKTATMTPPAVAKPSSPDVPRVPSPPPGAAAALPPQAERGPRAIAALVDEAVAHARSQAPDAVLVGYTASWTVDGFALSLPRSKVEVTFVVPSRREPPDPNRPANAQPDSRCRLVVTITADKIEHGLYVGACEVPPPARAALCPVDWVIARAARKGIDPALALDIELDLREDRHWWSVMASDKRNRVAVANDCALLAKDEVVPSTLPPLTTASGMERFTIPLQVDAVTFDPVAFIPTATQLARLLDPTAALIEMSADPLSPTGTMIWSAGAQRHGGVRYELGGARWCSVVVMISDDGSDVTVFRTGAGKNCVPDGAPPTCTRDELIANTRGPDLVSLHFSRSRWYVIRSQPSGGFEQTEVREPCRRP